jgi:hypothetical protein
VTMRSGITPGCITVGGPADAAGWFPREAGDVWHPRWLGISYKVRLIRLFPTIPLR